MTEHLCVLGYLQSEWWPSLDSGTGRANRQCFVQDSHLNQLKSKVKSKGPFIYWGLADVEDVLFISQYVITWCMAGDKPLLRPMKTKLNGAPGCLFQYVRCLCLSANAGVLVLIWGFHCDNVRYLCIHMSVSVSVFKIPLPDWCTVTQMFISKQRHHSFR